MAKIKKIVPAELCDYVEGLQYEMESRKDLLAFMIGRDIMSESFNKYHEEYLEYYSQFQAAKNFIANSYCTEDNIVSWNLNYNLQTLEIETND